MVVENYGNMKDILCNDNVLVFDCTEDNVPEESFIPAFTVADEEVAKTGLIADLDPSWKNIPVIDCSQWEYPEIDHDYRIYTED